MVSFTVFKGSKEGKIIRSDEVLVRISHSGLCGTDEHFKHNDVGLGHEGAGVVEVGSQPPNASTSALTYSQEIGRDVKTLIKGDSVSWGYQHPCCMECKHCLTGYETLCPNAICTATTTSIKAPSARTPSGAKPSFSEKKPPFLCAAAQ
jgi:D-arabinose 1-dehydrogenase-like Zn-dependent alcohol dehydrogenase